MTKCFNLYGSLFYLLALQSKSPLYKMITLLIILKANKITNYIYSLV